MQRPQLYILIMDVTYCLYWIIAICAIYLLFLLRFRRYRLVLTSTAHTLTWLVCSLLMLAEIKGLILPEPLPENRYSLSVPYILGMVVSSVIGFAFAHQISIPRERYMTGRESTVLTNAQLEAFLKKFQFIPILCVIAGVLMVSFLVSLGGFETFGDYRLMAVTVEKVGYAAVAKRCSGHLSILGGFYLVILGYQQAISGVSVKKTLINLIMVSTINLSIGGRLWVITSLLPYVTGFLLALNMRNDCEALRKSFSRLAMIAVVFVAMFSIMGMIRNTSETTGSVNDSSFARKFLYYTDGPKMANLALERYRPGTFDIEYGGATFLQTWVSSPMAERYKQSMADNIGLSVTVKSMIPNWYFDFGYWGGIVMWGVLCFLLESLCLEMRHKNTFLGILIFAMSAQILFQAPIGNIIFALMPTIEWLVVIAILNRWLFGSVYRAQPAECRR